MTRGCRNKGQSAIKCAYKREFDNMLANLEALVVLGLHNEAILEFISNINSSPTRLRRCAVKRLAVSMRNADPLLPSMPQICLSRCLWRRASRVA